MSEPGPWQVVFAPSAERAIGRLPEKIAAAVVEFTTATLPSDPARMSKPLRGELAEWRVARRGHYRIVLQLDHGARRIIIGRIEHRADAYRPR